MSDDFNRGVKAGFKLGLQVATAIIVVLGIVIITFASFYSNLI